MKQVIFEANKPSIPLQEYIDTLNYNLHLNSEFGPDPLTNQITKLWTDKVNKDIYIISEKAIACLQANNIENLTYTEIKIKGTWFKCIHFDGTKLVIKKTR